MGGYLYFQAIKDYNTHENERLRLLDEICHYDVLRSDKSIAGNGLEAGHHILTHHSFGPTCYCV